MAKVRNRIKKLERGINYRIEIPANYTDAQSKRSLEIMYRAIEEEINKLKERKSAQTMKKRIAPSLKGRPGADKDHAFNDK